MGMSNTQHATNAWRGLSSSEVKTQGMIQDDGTPGPSSAQSQTGRAYSAAMRVLKQQKAGGGGGIIIPKTNIKKKQSPH